MEYWTIEVLDGTTSAQLRRHFYGDILFEAAHTNRVQDSRWSCHAWGVAWELGWGERGISSSPAATAADGGGGVVADPSCAGQLGHGHSPRA